MTRTILFLVVGLLGSAWAEAGSPAPWQEDYRRPDGLQNETPVTRPDARTQRPLQTSAVYELVNPYGWHVDCRRPGRPFCNPDRIVVVVLDSDGDGVPDDLDNCPDTPLGVRVDENGCPLYEEERVLIDTGTLVLENIQFELDSAALLTSSYPILDRVGDVLSSWSQLEIEIGGYTDATGDIPYNQDLSQRRADTVRIYLLTNFPDIEADQLTAVGYGESNPVATNDTAEGRARNRRVEFKVLNSEVLPD
jgi:outer membrane protein OmpA-like peptidoglycan-associated protein